MFKHIYYYIMITILIVTVFTIKLTSKFLKKTLHLASFYEVIGNEYSLSHLNEIRLWVFKNVVLWFQNFNSFLVKFPLISSDLFTYNFPCPTLIVLFLYLLPKSSQTPRTWPNKLCSQITVNRQLVYATQKLQIWLPANHISVSGESFRPHIIFDS